MAQKDSGAVKKTKDVVSQDRNWVLRINNQMTSQKVWDKQWGYLSGGFSPQKTNVLKSGNLQSHPHSTIKDSLDQKIRQLQEQIKSIDARDIYSKSSDSWGKGNNVQLFANSKNNIRQGKDLRALQRRLPKNWKKAKWTPPVDPFDPIANMYKKKK